MLEKLYTTKMSSSAKTLQKRFSKIRSSQGRISRIAAAVSAVTLTCTAICATVVMAAVDGLDLPDGELIINGRSYAVDIIKVPTNQTTDTDSYYIPLREVYEKLGYTVIYDVDKSKYADQIKYDFPYYEDQEHGPTWLKSHVTNETDNYIYGQTGSYNRQFPLIEVIAPNGETEVYQVGSGGGAGFNFSCPVMVNDTVYVPIRKLAYIVGGIDNLKWDDAAHDTYYEGAVTFDKEALVITINY